MVVFLEAAPIDLDCVQVAVDGSRWLWTFEHTESDDPLMLRVDAASAGTLPLAEVYGQHGPLTPERRPTTAAMYRQVLEAA